MIKKAEVVIIKKGITQDLAIIETQVTINGKIALKRFTIHKDATSEQIQDHIQAELIKEEKQIVGKSFEVEL